MFIEFIRAKRGYSYATIHRRDGVVVELTGFSVKHRVPHDLAYAVAERELGLADGIFGSIAAGRRSPAAVSRSGRQRPDAAARSQRILRANTRGIGLSELLGVANHDAVEHNHRPARVSVNGCAPAAAFSAATRVRTPMASSRQRCPHWSASDANGS